MHVLSRRLLSLSSVSVLLLMLAALGGAHYHLQRSFQRNVLTALEAVRDTAIVGVEDWAGSLLNVTRLTAAIPEVVEATQADQPPSALRRLLSPELLGHGITGFEIVSAGGCVQHSSAPQPAASCGRPVPTQASLSPIHFDGDVPQLWASAPILSDSGERLGALRLQVNLTEALSPALERARAGSSGESYAISQDSRLLTRSRFASSFQQYGLEGLQEGVGLQVRDPGVDLRRQSPDHRERPMTMLAAQVTAGHQVTLEAHYRDYRGVPVVGTGAWLETPGVGLITEVDAAELEALNQEQARPLLLLGVVLWALLAGLLLLFHRARASLALLNEDLEARVQERTREAEAASRAKSDFLARISHDIRTPMHAVSGLLELAMAPACADPQRANLLQRAHSSADLLVGLLNDVLDLSQIEAGKLTLTAEDFPLQQVLAPLADLVRARCPEDVDFQVHIDSDVPEAVCGDPLRLAQVLTNLVGNASKFTEQGQISVLVSQAPGELLCFQVSDTGIGLDTAHADELLQPFTQSTARAPHNEGIGLGLPICKQLVEAMGGELSLDGAVGRGTVVTFTVRLPAAEAPQRVDAEPEADLTGCRILVVDDNPVNRLIARLALQQAGADISEADGGAAAIAHLKASAPDVVLLDLQMPDLDGFAVCSRARAAGITVPMIAMSASALTEDVQQARALGMDGFLPKPVATKKLIQTIALVARGERGALWQSVG